MQGRKQGILETKTYEQYILRKIAGPFFVITLAITGIAWLSQSLKFVDLIVNKGLSVSTFVYLSILILPSIMWVIIPAGNFIATVYGYNKLAGDSELVIFRSTGVDNRSLMRPVLIFCLLTTLVSYAISLYLLPASYRAFKDMQIYIRNNYASVLLQEGVFVNPTPGLTVYVKKKDQLGVLKGLIVYDNRQKDKRYTITAQEAELENTPKGPIFILKNGSHQEYNTKTKKFSLLYFDSYNLELELFNKEIVQRRWREVSELYLHELFFSEAQDKRERYKQISEGHYRITWPLYNVLLSMIGLIPFVKGEFSRRGNSKRIARCSVLAITFLLIALAIKSFTVKSIYLNIMAYVVVLGGIAWFYYYLTNETIKRPKVVIKPAIPGSSAPQGA